MAWEGTMVTQEGAWGQDILQCALKLRLAAVFLSSSTVIFTSVESPEYINTKQIPGM